MNCGKRLLAESVTLSTENECDALHIPRVLVERPQQAVLLATVPTDPGFNVDEVVGILRDTLDMARCRAVGTETLADLGHYVPGLFVPEGYAVTVEEAPA